MNDLEFQENLKKLTVAELLEDVNRLTESYSHKLALVTEELLIRQMQGEDDAPASISLLEQGLKA